MALQQYYTIKQTLRHQFLFKRNLLDITKKLIFDHNILSICQRFIDDSNFNKIALFRSTMNEINTLPIGNYLKSTNKKILYPRVNQLNQQLTFHYINSMNDWETGPLNILQPKSYCQSDDAELYIVPLLGYNHQGYRIGYGKGHYDRYFHNLKNNSHSFISIGLAYTWQFTDCIFQENFDFPLNYIINEISVRKI